MAFIIFTANMSKLLQLVKKLNSREKQTKNRSNKFMLNLKIWRFKDFFTKDFQQTFSVITDPCSKKSFHKWFLIWFNSPFSLHFAFFNVWSLSWKKMIASTFHLGWKPNTCWSNWKKKGNNSHILLWNDDEPF
jgi:hypothetical protein